MPEFTVYFQDPDLKRNLEEYLYLGVHTFLFTQKYDDVYFEDNFQRIRVFFRDFPCEVVRDCGVHMIRHTPGRTEILPVWSIEFDSVEELEEKLKAKPRMLFIRNKKGRGLFSKEYGRRLAAIFDFRERYDVPIVMFGPLRFSAMFQSNLDGAGISMRTPSPGVSPHRDWQQIAIDGKYLYRSPLLRAMLLAGKFRTRQMEATCKIRPHRTKGLDSALIRTIMMYQAVHDYQMRIREAVGAEEYDAIKYLPDEFFPENMEFHDPTVVVKKKVPLLSQALPGDQIVCNTCSLKYRCPLYQEGSVCIVPNSEGKSLADFFCTRDADTVLMGMEAILRKQAERTEGAVEAEEERIKQQKKDGKPVEYSDQVSKMLSDLQKNSERFLKLVDPRFTKPLVQINQAQITQNVEPRNIDPAAAKQELLDMGMRPEQITADVIARYQDGTFNGPRELAAGGPNVIDADSFPTDF